MLFFKKIRLNSFIIDFYIQDLLKYRNQEYEMVLFHLDFFLQPLCYSFNLTLFNMTISVNYFKKINKNYGKEH